MNRVPITECFTGLSETYDRHRPGYPVDAISAIVEGATAPVIAADIGCGTGISVRLLANHVERVIGIDPNEDMLALAREKSAARGNRMEFRKGTGENTGLADASVSVVLCAQSFHWFEAERALREFHRILIPSGRLALMWNVRDDRDAFSAAYGEVVHRAQADAARRGLAIRNDHAADIAVGNHFTQLSKRRFANPQAFDLEGLLGRARSASYFPREGPVRVELENVLRELFRSHQIDNQVVLHQFAEVTLGLANEKPSSENAATT
jgi:ubiquinone/menaquinone biosynthesis C-methylase UbiE